VSNSLSNKLVTYLLAARLSNFKHSSRSKFKCIAPHNTLEKIGHRLRVQQKATKLIQTADCLQSKVGMHLMGVPMAVQKGVAVGSYSLVAIVPIAPAYMISALVQLYSQCS
jgi:hypothetical protein